MIPSLFKRRNLAEAPAAPASKPEPAAALQIAALVDRKQQKIACALIQAAYRCDSSVCHLFDDWVTHPTPVPTATV